MDTPPVQEGDPEVAAFWRRFWRWTVAALQVIGGLLGLYNLMYATVTGLPGRVLFLLGFVLFVASIWGGILLARDRRDGIIVSLILQSLQVFQLVADSLVYSFFTGVQLILGLHTTDTNFNFDFGYYLPCRFLVIINPPSAIPGVKFSGVNLVAVLAIFFLLHLRAVRSQSFLPTPEPKL